MVSRTSKAEENDSIEKQPRMARHYTLTRSTPAGAHEAAGAWAGRSAVVVMAGAPSFV
jgi:hypothetical protein